MDKSESGVGDAIDPRTDKSFPAQLDGEKAQILQIDFPPDNALLGSKVIVRGRAVPQNPSEEVVVEVNQTLYPPRDANGYWQVEDDLTSLPYPTIIFAAMIRNPMLRVSKSVTWEKNCRSFIGFPAGGTVLPQGQPFTITGQGITGSTVTVTNVSTGLILGTRIPGARGYWEMQIIAPTSGTSFIIEAVHDGLGGSHVPHRVTYVLAPNNKTPEITLPLAGTVQDQKFRVSGKNGVSASTMQVFIDLTETKVGEAAVTGDNWSVEVNVDPGRLSLVAKQILNNYPPGISLPRFFDIRPPALTKVNVTVPDAITVKFDGDGHEGATVAITVVSGPGGAAPGEAKVVSGKWATSATNWPDGLYKMRAIQKVSNNAGAWIESAPIEFEATYLFPPPSDVKSTAEYQTTISGNGLLGATVSVLDSDKLTKIAPDAPVRSDNTWFTKAYVSWGPTLDRTIYVHQFIGIQKSASVENKVRIPPIAPGIDSVSPDGLSPTFTGTCELNAQVNLVFSGSATSYPAVVTGTKWSFQRTLPFTPDIEHTVIATQIAAQQTSPEARRPFKQQRPMVAVVITHPAQDSEIGHGDVTFKGTDGMKGATVSVWDYVNGGTLDSVKLDADGPWEITVRMTFGRWVVRAKQVIDDRESAHSDSRVFHVVLLQPEIAEPAEAGTLTRTSTIRGTGEPFGYVDVFLESATTPFLEKVRIGGNGRWQAEATMPVGDKTIRARQYFQSQISRDTQPRSYKVVPHSPIVETPAAGDHAGRHTMVSGFGVWGDKVKVKLGPGTGPALGEALVAEDRTWSIPVEILRAGPAVSFVATSSEGDFESAASAPRSVLAGIFEPTIQSPAEGEAVTNPVPFAGTGQDGEAQICSWYNPDVIQASGLRVTTATGWQGVARIALSPGGNWSVIQQTLTKDQDGATVSDKVTSHRFEVGPVPSEGKSSDIPDKWSP
ncbi:MULTISPECIES: hypothetical protein [unclassified Pseudomonas]|uniref:hypothetical protein n=1 Tax=unclassified Pseudomonas TaxID=196821 RepID=UPI001179F47F|nr:MULTISPECIES: hypothetical protein [unclassified Pseudomonas]